MTNKDLTCTLDNISLFKEELQKIPFDSWEYNETNPSLPFYSNKYDNFGKVTVNLVDFSVNKLFNSVQSLTSENFKSLSNYAFLIRYLIIPL